MPNIPATKINAAITVTEIKTANWDTNMINSSILKIPIGIYKNPHQTYCCKEFKNSKMTVI